MKFVSILYSILAHSHKIEMTHFSAILSYRHTFHTFIPMMYFPSNSKKTAILFHAVVYRSNEWKENANVFRDCYLSCVKNVVESTLGQKLWRSYCIISCRMSLVDTNSFTATTCSHLIFNCKCRWLTLLSLKKQGQFSSHLQETNSYATRNS